MLHVLENPQQIPGAPLPVSLLKVKPPFSEPP